MIRQMFDGDKGKGEMSKIEKKVINTSVGNAVPRRQNSFMQGLSIAILAWLGWSIKGTVPNLPKFVVIGAPHTSNWDWLLVMAVAYALGVRISWMMKHSLFKGPLAWFWRSLGGIPVDRRAANGIVGDSVSQFQQARQFILCITPEGTRSKVKEWKTGFYHIALGAGVPIVPAIFDYGRKQVRFAAAFTPTGNLNTDLPTLQALYGDATPKNKQ